MNEDKFEGFENPNFTQTPNSFFDDVVKEIKTLSEMKVTLTLIRETFGFHRNSKGISISGLVELTGMSEDSIKSGLKKGIKRETIVKVSDYDPKTQSPNEYALNFVTFKKEEDLAGGKDYPEGKETPQDESNKEGGVKDYPEAGGKVTSEDDTRKANSGNGSGDPLNKGLNKDLNKVVVDKVTVEKIKQLYNRIFPNSRNMGYHMSVIEQYLQKGLEIELVINQLEKTGLSNKPNMNYLIARLDGLLDDGITSVSKLEERNKSKGGIRNGSKRNGSRVSSSNKPKSKGNRKKEPKYRAERI